MSNLISAPELKIILDHDNVKIFDASNHPQAYSNYLKNHIKGSYFIDVNKELADIKDDVANGGRHPLPSINDFQQTIQQYGIQKSDQIVVYDDKSGANAAARFWWMLKAIGHEKVQVLDGGFKAALDFQLPITDTLPKKIPSIYDIDTWLLPITSLSEVITFSMNELKTIVDVREYYRYAGESEPIDLIAGHIPHAINMPYINNLDEEGKFKSKDALKLIYQSFFGNKNSKDFIFHCGSGITACHSLLACQEAGFEIPSLYVGSWSEWSRNNQEMILKIE